MPFNIFSVTKPPYEQYLYISYGEGSGGMVRAFVWHDSTTHPATVIDYPAEDNARALKDIKELSDLIISTRRILGLPTPVREPQRL